MNRHKLIENLGIVIAAGGSGTRFSLSTLVNDSKLLTPVKLTNNNYNHTKIPLFLYSILEFSTVCSAENMVLVIKKEDEKKFMEALDNYLPAFNPLITYGGATRMHSVYNGLSALKQNIKYVAVHDAARPLATKELLLKCLSKAKKYEAGAIPAKKIINTVKLSDEKGFVQKTLNRDLLWSIETPQVFPLNILIQAYKTAFADKISATDDSGIMEHSGFKPFLVEHSENNKKITFQYDLENNSIG